MIIKILTKNIFKDLNIKILKINNFIILTQIIFTTRLMKVVKKNRIYVKILLKY